MSLLVRLYRHPENVIVVHNSQKWFEEGGFRIAPHVAWDIIKPRL